jgi:serine/threonine protein kinase
VKERGPLPVAEACEFIRQAAIGLQHAHEHGLVHRDIKPSNLMLTASGERKLPESALQPAAASSRVAAHNQGADAPKPPRAS